jgi:hypothetical protein
MFTELSIPEFLVRFALSILAVYRLTHAFSTETGPFAIFANFREWVWKRYKNNGDAWQVQFVQCPLCQSFWGGLLAALLVFPVVSLVDTLLVWVSVSGGVLVLHLRLYK